MPRPPTILLLGSTGQLGIELLHQLSQWSFTIAPARKELDLEDVHAINTGISRLKPDVIVNAAAYTDVDRAQTEIDEASWLNEEVPRLLALQAKSVDALLVHFSTDYVFDGHQQKPYTESDPVHARNMYGQTKYNGEQLISAYWHRHLIFRTSWLWSPWRRNFAKTMLSLARRQDQINVVNDQIGTPNYAQSIAMATTIGIVLSLKNDVTGLFHLSAQGQTSWYEFAHKLLAQSGDPHRRLSQLSPISSDTYRSAATRPAYSVLDCHKIDAAFGIHLGHWDHLLAQHAAHVLQQL